MNLKDIVNRDLVNLTNCDHEPIHIPGSIQPHGCLFSVNTGTGTIEFVSENIFEFTGYQLTDLIGQKWETFFPERNLSELVPDTASKQETVRLPFPSGNYEAHYHISGNQAVFELERIYEKKDLAPDLINLSSEFVDYIENTSTIRELCDRVVRGIKKVTGYDRVMVYRFDELYNGAIIAESKNEALESFQDLHYPHTDIPSQARELYLKNQLRVIADVNYTAVPIYTAGNGHSKDLDLSFAVLRSVSPIHCQYLRNMGVGATLTISLVHKQKLWGLIACHHYSPKTISYEVKMAAKLLGHIITSQLEARQISEQFKVTSNCNAALTRVTSLNFRPERSYLQELATNADTLKICNASGVAFVFDGKVYQSELSPGRDYTLELCRRLRQTGKGKEMQITSLLALYPEFDTFCETFPGVLFFPLSETGGILWFRQEPIKNITWAGDPSKAIEKVKGGLSPRKSFEQWKDIVKCQSTNWLSPEIIAARNFADVTEKFIQSIRLSEERDKQKELSETVSRTNSELEVINWISTHDLQEPLRKIRMTASILLNENEKLPSSAHKMIVKMSEHAAQTQALMKDIQKYSRLSGSADHFSGLSLNTIVQEITKQLEQKLSTRRYEFHIDKLPAVEGIAVMIRSVFYTLFENAINLSDPGEALKISITYSGISDGLHKISFIEHHSEAKKGQALNGNSGNPGFAMCQKIMEKHQGQFYSGTNIDNGRSFHLNFPVTSSASESGL